MVGWLAEAEIVVVRAGRTSRDAAVAVREGLAEDGTRVVGIVLPRSPRPPQAWEASQLCGAQRGPGRAVERNGLIFTRLDGRGGL